MDKLIQLDQLLADAKVDATKFFEKNNNSAGARLRANMLAIKKLSHEIRKEVSEIKNAE